MTGRVEAAMDGSWTGNPLRLERKHAVVSTPGAGIRADLSRSHADAKDRFFPYQARESVAAGLTAVTELSVHRKAHSVPARPDVRVMTRNPTGMQEPVAALRLRNTAEPSRELSVGDIVAAGEAPLAVAKAGWVPVSGCLTEVRTSEHGTRPLPEGSRPFDAAGDAASPCADEGGS